METNERPVIVVLGGGLTREGNVPKHTELRLLTAIDIYKSLYQKTNIRPLIITLSGGTPHKPNPLDKAGFPVFEASAAANWLLERREQFNIETTDVFEECFSLDTVGNAYFLRTTHIDVGRYRTLYVVTNDWHMARSRAMFEHVFSLPVQNSPSGSNIRQGSATNGYEMHYISAPSGIDDQEVLTQRQGREAASLQTFQTKTKLEFQSMQEMHQWIFSKHGAYASMRMQSPDYHKAVLDPDLMKSY